MKRTLLVLALSAACGLPVLAQPANYCDPSGYATGVVSDRDNPHEACNPRQVPRVQGVPQGQPAPDARRHYNSANSPLDPRSDPRYSGYTNDRWREGNYYYGARGPEWRRGAHVPREYMGRQYWVNDWRAHRLAPPPRGYQWVQVGNDYVLIALATGIIAQLMLSQ